MIQPLALSALLVVGAPKAAQAQDAPAEPMHQVHAVRLTGAVSLDGALTEPVWQNGLATTDFTQRDPVEGAPATERTEVRIAYDEEAIYVGARMYDSEPTKIVARLGRRDAWLSADAFVFYVDPYDDGRSGFLFSVNAAGTLWDGTLFNDDWDDYSWDGVWEGRARIDEKGWTAEMRIPYSQLRFHAGDRYKWGVNARRYVGRKKEDDYLVFTPKKANGFVSRFLDLVGIEGVTPPRRVGVLPYTVTKGEYLNHAVADPFNDGSRYAQSFGADAKIGLGSNLTLDATVNPDFGQVEVDPAVVNLSDVETFFEEKRPFFIEGSSTFNFGHGGASNYIGFNWGDPNFFYSRRVGRAPQGSLPEADFSDSPGGVRILGAGKLTGKVGSHWNLGTLHAITARETASLQAGGVRSRAEVEPASYYGVFRAQREFPENRHGIGIMATAVARKFDDPRLRDEIDARAFALGADGWAFLGADKRWVMTGWTGLSRVSGSERRISDLQQTSQHYFQRPDATHVQLDPTATSLTGLAGRATVNKEKGNVLFNAAVGFIDPGFDVNELGFLWRGDVINTHVWGGYRWTNPGRWTRSADVEVAAFRSWDFGGNTTWQGFFGFGFAEFLNYYRVSGFAAYNPQTVSNNRTRGGPLTINPPGWEWDAAVRTDDRRNLWARVGLHGFSYERDSSRGGSVFPQVEWRPRPNISVSLAPELGWSHTDAQWIGNFDDPLASATFGKRYVFANLDQRYFVAGVRVNWTFTPRLSLQVYAQPLVSSGDYSSFGELARPRSYDFLRYGDGPSTVATAGDTYRLDPDGAGPAPAIEVGNPDFNFRSLRGNAVLRWEFRRGSTLYCVWTQNRADTETIGRFDFGRSAGRLFDIKADNIFLVKIAYWWSR